MLDEAACTLDEIDPADKRRREVLHAQLELAIAGEQWNSARGDGGVTGSIAPGRSCRMVGPSQGNNEKPPTQNMPEAVLTKARKWHPEIALLILDLAREATALGCLKEAKIWLKCAIHLQASVRSSALRDLRLKPLWKWIEATS
jgi:hypothetical protein